MLLAVADEEHLDGARRAASSASATAVAVLARAPSSWVTIATRDRPASTVASDADRAVADDDVVRTRRRGRPDAPSRSRRACTTFTCDRTRRAPRRRRASTSRASVSTAACAAASYAGVAQRASRRASAPAHRRRAAGGPSPSPTRAASTSTGARSQTTNPPACEAPAVLGVDDGSPTHAITSGAGDAHTSATACALERAERGLARRREHLGDRHAREARDDVVGVDERTRRAARAPPADRRLPRTHQPDQHEVARCVLVIAATRGRRRGCARTRRASRRRTCAAPPREHERDHRLGDDTRRPGTAVTSVRSLNETVASFVSTSTVFEHRAVERRERLHRRRVRRAARPWSCRLRCRRARRLAPVVVARRRPTRSRRAPRCPAGRRRRSRRRSRPPSSPGCSSTPGRAARRCGGPSARATRARAARRTRAPRRRRRASRPPSPPP